MDLVHANLGFTEFGEATGRSRHLGMHRRNSRMARTDLRYHRSPTPSQDELLAFREELEGGFTRLVLLKLTTKFVRTE